MKPSAVLHMMGYGLAYGFFLAMLYIWIGIVVAALADNIDVPSVFGLMAYTAFISFLLGALPGIVFGFIDGCILGVLASRIHIPIGGTGLRQWRNLSYLIIGGLTLTGMSFLTLPVATVLSLEGSNWSMLWFSVPIPIATFASIYAVHRYFLKLRAWGSFGKAKNKAKHSPTNQLTDEDAAELENYLVDEGVVKQQMQHKQ